MKNNNRGFISIVIMIVAGLVLLKYIYDIDVVEFFTTGKPKIFLDKFYSWSTTLWDKYKDIILAVWNYAVDLLKALLDKVKS